jgi:hypothetical protein
MARPKRKPIRWRFVLTVAVIVGAVLGLGVYFGNLFVKSHIT